MGITSLLEAHCTLIERTVVIRHQGYRVRVNVSFMNRKALGFFAPGAIPNVTTEPPPMISTRN